MKYKILLLLLIATVLPAQTTFFIKYKSTVPLSYATEKTSPGKLINTKLLKGVLHQHRTGLLARGLGKEDEVLGRIIKVQFSTSDITEDELRILLDDPNIEYIQKSITYKVDAVPNDSLVSEQWALNKINAFRAWDITTGSDTVLLAIIDTGIDYLHPDLKNKINFNPAETGLDERGQDKRYNGIDDDGNGFIDDYMGWDFTDRLGFPFDSTGGDYLDWDNNPDDEAGHGTYIAGVAAAETNNNSGIAGAAPGIKILNIRAFDPNGYGEEDDAAAAILYAVNMGAKVINMSFGDNSFSFVLRDVIRYAHSKNVILVASSGNSGSDMPHYPSGYSEVISVGNSTENDFVSSSSNFGSTIDLVAPGSLIKTTAINSSFASVSGTSLAAPFVSAAAALIISKSYFTNEEVRQILKSTSDDIDAAGWDIKSGAGRLNLFKALTVTAPSLIRFDYPKQDFGTLEDTIKISATVLSSYFQNYELYFGTGITPRNWKMLTNGSTQFESIEIYNLDISGLADSVYTLRLVVHQSNGRTTEERLNFYIQRIPPKSELVTIGPALYGSESTILASVYTEVPTVVKMYYKRVNTAENFKYITLDGFATNNQFVKTLHYGFIPKELVSPETTYEIYLESENLTGLKTIIKNGDINFLFSTSFNAAFVTETEKPYQLPFGQLFESPVNITGENDDIIFNGLYPGFDFYYGIYSFVDDGFRKVDSIKNKIPRVVGDFNKNGKTDILSTIQRSAYIDEQTTAGSPRFSNYLSDTTGGLWASFAGDIDGDDNPEIVGFGSDTTIVVVKLANDFSRVAAVTLNNFSEPGINRNRFGYPRIITADTDMDGNNELWTVDNDGDILGYEIDNQEISPLIYLPTGLAGSAEYITSGDFNGDKKPEIAVLLRSFQNFQIAPFNYALVFNEDSILFEQAFIDPSAEFNSNFNTVWNSIKFADIDNDQRDELITFTFPYSYIFKQTHEGIKIISYKENVNSRTIFTGDLDKNGVPEVAFPVSEGIKFIEFANSEAAATPAMLEGYSLDSNLVFLSWTGRGNRYLIYKGTSDDNLVVYDSTTNTEYKDENVENNTIYYYAVQAFESSKPKSYSSLSKRIAVYTHTVSKASRILNSSANSLEVYFTEKINTTVLDLSSFFLVGIGIPVSISPSTEYSYLLTFKGSLVTGENILYIRNLKDFYGSPVKEDTVRINISPVVIPEKFYISSHQIITPYRIRVAFNLPVHEGSVIIKGNYSFEPENFIESIEQDIQDPSVVYINLEKKRPIGAVGREFKLKIENLRSSIESGNIKINEGAGSTIVLNAFASDLSGVYPYPNPVRSNNSVMFAGLPQKARIVIFNINGEQLKTIEERDGNGGVEYDLTDNYGKKLNSGIYIFRVVMLDELNNEVQEKLGKFAVIK